MNVKITATLKKFKEQGEKTGWTYVEVPQKAAQKINPDVKKSFRVKGTIDAYAIKLVSLIPMGGGDFIMPINAVMRKNIKKHLVGEKVILLLEKDADEVLLSEDLLLCLAEDKKALAYFKSIPQSHQKYYSRWIESAKTTQTKAKRIAQALHAFSLKLSYSEMMRMNKQG
ncbi:MAG: DUF1905 domain-containing protein [Bacteroidetes bacterium]|nr:DUF1905 domain-containing protein [Bacteroidota bacterium]